MSDAKVAALGALVRLAAGPRPEPPDAPWGAMAGAPTPQALLEAALEVAQAHGWVAPSGARAVAMAAKDIGELLGIPADVRTWRRIRDELVTLRKALHIEGDQTATDAARGLEDVAAHVLACASLKVSEVDEDDGGVFVMCCACGSSGADHADIEHDSHCVLALAWRALGKPGAVGSAP